MKPFKIIQGNSKELSKFEEEISQAIEDGYEISSDLICKTVKIAEKEEIYFFQPMTIEENLDFENEDLDYTNSEEDAAI